MLRIHEIKLNIDETTELLPLKIIRKLNRPDLTIAGYRIVKESIDARDKSDIKRVYSIDFTPASEKLTSEELEEKLLKSCLKIKLERAPDRSYERAIPGTAEMKHPPVIVGFGPCGMFAGLILAEMGYRPVILERGKTVEDRIEDVRAFWEQGILDEESNVQFGEGGAGTFSDGKLTTQIKDPRIHKVLEELILAGGPEEIAYKQKAHIGTDVLRNVVMNIRKKILHQGGEILFQSKLTGIDIDEHNGIKKLTGIQVNGKETRKADQLILAIGHSARDTFRFLYREGIEMKQKPFSIGVRIEHPQRLINEAQYGRQWESYELGAADYKLSYHCSNGRGVYTFCMCPGGHVIGAASQSGGVVTNGMSFHSRDGLNSNSGLLVDVKVEDFEDESPLSGIAFQEKYERLAYEAGGGNYKAPAQKVRDFLNLTEANTLRTDVMASEVSLPATSAPETSLSETVIPTYSPGVVWTDLSLCLPKFAVESMKEAIPALGKKLKGFDRGDAVLTGVETRSSSPVRIVRDQSLMSNIKGIYPGGEGAGYAGGIISAAVDGIRLAEEIIKRYQKPL
ncbi:NAD(P)/FAD-dependent oxidoreductase [Sinanaerobacter chloroacetimidivorans]|uniref:FAD-dependent protein C-terminal domain-containing protein n=1 Tax=Sinanaerobacter chloroacetimidivorans TaxID=2818044 RepID=A0A8J7W1T0_9FIRM|nr:hypothetical protein [Sinanaerobacter chloroacetimidivorans]MBR0598821.1 hypothetical protein [Sinanaerobacter chloroacetimidivorans]